MFGSDLPQSCVMVGSNKHQVTLLATRVLQNRVALRSGGVAAAGALSLFDIGVVFLYELTQPSLYHSTTVVG